MMRLLAVTVMLIGCQGNMILQVKPDLSFPPSSLYDDTPLRNDPNRAIDVCYDELGMGELGCFSTEYPYSDRGRIAYLPQSPEKVDTTFLLVTPESSADFILKTDDKAGLARSFFKGERCTKMIVHGWIDSGYMSWLEDMANDFIIAEGCNVIKVDWKGGSRGLYGQSCGNTRLVGLEIWRILKFLKAETGLDMSTVHIMGHSLGSHACGYAGWYAKQQGETIGRLTGMDPANPYFEHMHSDVRLDPEDGAFVDVIHADGGSVFNILNPFNGYGGLGMREPCGHVDFYPNGGEQQPGCGDHQLIMDLIMEGLIEAARQLIACSHMRGYEFMEDSVRNKGTCTFKAYRAPNYELFKTGKYLKHLDTIDFNNMGNGAQNVATPNETYYLATGERDAVHGATYCRWHYHIKLQLRNKGSKEGGTFFVNLQGKNGETGFVKAHQIFDSKYVTFKANEVFDWLLIVEQDIGALQNIEVYWDSDNWKPDWLTKPSIYPHSVSVFSGDYQTSHLFCDSAKNSGDLQTGDKRSYSTTSETC